MLPKQNHTTTDRLNAQQIGQNYDVACVERLGDVVSVRKTVATKREKANHCCRRSLIGYSRGAIDETTRVTQRRWMKGRVA